MGKHRQMVDVSAVAKSLRRDYCDDLLGFYVFTGEDCTSAFKGKGKVAPLKKLQKKTKYLKTVQQLGSEWNVKPELYQQLEIFTYLIYGYPRETRLNEVSALMLKKMVGEDERITTKSKVELSMLHPVLTPMPLMFTVSITVLPCSKGHICRSTGFLNYMMDTDG